MELCPLDTLLFLGTKSYHEFVLDLQGLAYHVRGPVRLSRLEAFAFIIPQLVSADSVVTYGRLFPEEPPAIVQVLDSMRKAAPAGVRVARHKLKPPNPSTPGAPKPTLVKGEDLLYLRHTGLASARVLRAVHRLQLDSGWLMERLHQAEDRALPAFDRALSSTSLLVQIVAFLLGGCGKLVATSGKDPPPPNANLVLGVYADGYRPRGRGNVNTKSCVIDMEGLLFPHVNHVPQCNTMVTCSEMLKNRYNQWVREGRSQELNRWCQTPFTLPAKWQGHTSNTLVRVTFRLRTAHHHHLWWKRGGRCCVVCPWKRHDGVRGLFGCHTQSLRQMGKRFVGVEGLEEAFVVQPSLQNLKGGISRVCGVVGCVLPLEDACEVFRYVGNVAPRYKLPDIPVDSKQYCSLVRRRFRNGISFTGPEAREFSALVAQDCVVPLPFHLLLLSYCHIVVLLYASDTCLPEGEWGAWGNLHVYLIHLILKYAESGSTATLYLHGLSHAFAQPHLPIQFSDEAGKRDLRLGKTFATLTTTCPEHSIRATLSHELYMKFTDRKLRQSQARLWKPVRQEVVLEKCVLSASPEWRVIAERIIRPLMAQSSIRVLCHPMTRSILLQLDPTVLEHGIYALMI